MGVRPPKEKREKENQLHVTSPIISQGKWYIVKEVGQIFSLKHVKSVVGTWLWT